MGICAWPSANLLRPCCRPPLRAHPALSVEGADVYGCTKEALATGWLGTTASKLEGDVVYMDYSAAIATMEAATGQMACMTERATPEALARFWYVGGVAAARGGRTELATGFFQAALGTGVTVEWDADMGDEGRAVFDAARSAAPEPVQLAWEAPSWSQSVWIDGRSANPGMTIAAGQHLIQAQTPAGWVGFGWLGRAEQRPG